LFALFLAYMRGDPEWYYEAGLLGLITASVGYVLKDWIEIQLSNLKEIPFIKTDIKQAIKDIDKIDVKVTDIDRRVIRIEERAKKK